jgi:transcriptional regulator with XRE-family HTH domain
MSDQSRPKTRSTSAAGAEKSAVAAAGPDDFNSLSDAVAVVTGRRPTDREIRESAWYDSLRNAVRLARQDAGSSQTDVANCLGLTQSEVSRLETSLGPGTRLGRLRDYLGACAAEIDMAITTTQGRRVAASERPDELAQKELLPEPAEEPLLEPEAAPAVEGPAVGSFGRIELGQWVRPLSGRLTGAAAGNAPELLVTFLLALDDALAAVDLPRQTSAALHRKVLEGLLVRARTVRATGEAVVLGELHAPSAAVFARER